MTNSQFSPGLFNELSLAAEAERRRRARTKINRYYPEAGELRRELYPRHISFFAAGRDHRERLMLAANRVGKTEGVGAYEVTTHLTGKYPAWWEGRRFDRPIKCWAAGDTSKTVREIIQDKLLGPAGSHGTGMIPGDAIVKTTAKAGTADAIDTIWVRHASGGISTLVLKSYDQRRPSFQGTEQDVIWLDEEPPEDVYSECLLRTMTTNGLVMCTFTPLNGLTPLVLTFLPGGTTGAATTSTRFVVSCTWDDVPHLSREVKDELWASIPPHQRDARAKGMPALGSGAIYPVPESDITVADFPLPAHWPRGYGLDVGWNRTAAVWGALDRETSTIYLYSEHYRGNAEPVIHTEAIKGRGAWIPGVIDPAARGRGQRDGEQLLQDYVDLGLDLDVAVNARESGLYQVWQLLSSGRLKVFKSLTNWLEEFRLYRRDDKGQIVKEKDHLMDCTRYFVMSGRERMKTLPAPKPNSEFPGTVIGGNYGGGWMA
jgi:phage terminase large subunit-like protein